MSDYPFAMRHPAHAPAVLSSQLDRPGSPERFPNIVVENAQQEEVSRSRGYLRVGEAMPTFDAKIEFPKILSHPHHAPGAPATKESVVHDGKVIVVDVPARQEKFPDVTVHSAQEEAEWAEKGYHPAGHFDGEAYEKAQHAPGVLGDEYPRCVYDDDGELLYIEEDPDKPVDESRLYPMMVYAPDGTELGTANSAAEKAALLARGSSKHEPQKKHTPYVQQSGTPAVSAADFAEWQEFQAFKAWRAAQAVGASEMVEVRSVIGEVQVNVLPEHLPGTPEAELDALRKEAEELGIVVDKRWREGTLRDKIDVALSK